MSKKIVGVDGCRAGWLAVGERSDGLFVELWPDLRTLFAESWDFCCIDIPIGLLTGKRRRECDLEARALLGKNRSSIFFAPPRDQIEARDYEQVRKEGMSLQTFYLLPKIREVDGLIEPSSQAYLKEAHPELAYRSRSETVLDKKKCEVGRQQRQKMLREFGSPFLLESWKNKFLRKQVALDDFLDAAVLLEVAREWSNGVGRLVGGEQTDSRGLKMEICY